MRMRSICADTRSLFVACLVTFFSASVCEVQSFCQQLGATVNGATATPIPGAGHDYIHLLSETVDPSSGQVSVRITPPIPPGRGLTLPLSITYDSGGARRLDNRASLVWIPETFSAFTSPNGQGGWRYAVPYLNADTWSTTIGSGTLTVYCNFYSDFTYTDISGTGHNLGLAGVAANGPGVGSGGSCGSPSQQGGDSQISAYLGGGANSFGPVYVQDTNGTTYWFSASGGVPSAIEDRNGNEITNFLGNSNGYPLGYTDTAGRPVVSVTGTGASGSEDTVSIGGLTYLVEWTTVSGSYSVLNHYIPPSPGIGCDATSVPSVSDTQTVISAIKLPNGTQYSFSYNSFGLLSQITYPEGGWVKYTWTTNPQTTGSPYSTLASFAGTNGSQSFPNACLYQYTPPQIYKRQVSFDGTNVALTQTFAPVTTWPAQSGSDWTGKSTTVTTTDPALGSFLKTYTYTPFGIASPPYVPEDIAAAIPLESTITTKDWSGAVIDKETKAWYNQFELGCDVHDMKGDGTLVAGHFYQYSYGQISDDKEYDFGQSSSLASSCLSNTPPSSVTPLRETVTAYQAFTNAYAARFGVSFQFAKPQSIMVYGSGTKVAETDYAYSTAVTAVPGGPAVHHDETVYGAALTPARGNPTTITRLCLYNCTQNAVTTIAYDAAGQTISVTDPCGNTACSDMTATSHTTTYSYADSYNSCSGNAPPSTPTDAYLTQVTSPPTNTVNHIASYCYDYTSGLLRSSTGENTGEVTSYSYSDPLNRLTETDYPDGGKTTYCYKDSASSSCSGVTAIPSVVATRLMNATQNLVGVTAMNGLGATVSTSQWASSTSAGAINSDITLDGMGNPYKVYNPYIGTSGAYTTYVHDPLGRTVQVTNTEGNSQWWCYNGVVSVSQLNCVTRLGTGAGSWVDYTDESGNHWQRVSDGLGRLQQVVEPNGTSTSPSLETDYTYDGLNDLIQVDQYGGMKGSSSFVERQRKFTYDSLSRLATAANPESGTTTYTYDVNGNIATKKDARAVTISYTYDALNRLNWKHYSDGFTITAGFGYDGKDATGNPISPAVSNAVGRLSQLSEVTAQAISNFSYDAMGRPVSKHGCVPGDCTYDITVSGQYDKVGNLTQLTNGSATHPITFNYTYDDASRLATISGSPAVNSVSTLFQANSTSPISYGPAGLQYAQLGIDTSGVAAFTLNRSYDVRLRRMYEGDFNSGGASVYNFCIPSASNPNCTSSNAGFTANGNLAKVIDSVMGTWTYQYDTLDRVTSSGASGGPYNADTGCWVYDPFGNRTSESMSTTACSGNPAQLSWATYTTSNTNRADTTSRGGNSVDLAGNIIYDGLYKYLYDGEGRVCAAQNTVSGTMTGYIYDSAGTRVGRGTITSLSCAKSSNGFTPTAGFVTGFGGEQLTETNGSTGWTHTNVFAGGTLLASYHDSDIYFAFNDWLGTKRAEVSVTNSCGTMSNSLPYGDYLTPGALTGYSTQCADATEHHFTGKERDTESGNDYFGARYYGSSMGRLLSPDPEEPTPLHLLNPQRWNMYAYGLNNPLSFTDSDGRDAAAVNFSKEIAIVGHEGIMSVHSDGTVVYARFGPLGGNRATGPGQVQSFTLKAKVQFDGNGRPTSDSLNEVKKELATTGPEKGQDPSSIRLNYFKTTASETANLDAWIQQQQDISNSGKYHEYDVKSTNCTWFCARGLVAAGALDQNQANQASPAPNGFWRQLQQLQSSEPCARTSATDSSGQGTGWSACQ